MSPPRWACCWPAPTNTLIGIAGARGRLARMARRQPAELAGYPTTILPLALLGEPLIAGFPAFVGGLKLAAAAWIMVFAVRLWRLMARGNRG